MEASGHIVIGHPYALFMKALIGGAAIAASMLVLTGCGGSSETAGPTSQSASAMASPTSTASPSATPTPSKITPSAIATSGSYAADLARLGIKPDSVADYGAWMKKMICDKSGTALGVSVRSIGGDTVASGGGPETVRLTVAYFCPTHSAAVEKEFKYFSQ